MKEITKLFDFPIKTFNPNNLYKEIMKSEDGAVFFLDQKEIKEEGIVVGIEVVLIQVKRINEYA